MGANDDTGKLPGWTLLVGFAIWLLAACGAEICRFLGWSWEIGVPVGLVVLAVGTVAESRIERRHLPSRRKQEYLKHDAEQGM